MNGVINVYKPKGITSFDAVKKIKILSEGTKVGHTGTLDPIACGVLPICIGKATKIVNYIMNENKIYKCTLKLGIITDTYDKEGKIIKYNDVCTNEQEIVNVINGYIGTIYQIPPMYSALKVDGIRLYKLARQNVEIEREKRKIMIHNIQINKINLPYIDFTVKCSKGTYIRSLCYDIGNDLKCGGTMWSLERISTGNFTKESSVKLDDLTKGNIKDYLISMEDVLKDYESFYIEKAFEKPLMNGVALTNPWITNKAVKNKLYRVYIDDTFIGIGRLNDKGFKIVKFLI